MGDDDLDLGEIKQLLDRVVNEITDAPDRVRYVMNNFVIAVGSYVKPLLQHAKQAGEDDRHRLGRYGRHSLHGPQCHSAHQKGRDRRPRRQET